MLEFNSHFWSVYLTTNMKRKLQRLERGRVRTHTHREKEGEKERGKAGAFFLSILNFLKLNHKLTNQYISPQSI